MHVRTYVGILIGVVIVFALATFTGFDREQLRQPFYLTPDLHMPFYGALLFVFLAGFLPVGTVLLVQSLKRDLSERRERRLSREARSYDQRLRRAIDFQVDRQWGKAISELEFLLGERPEDFATLLRYGEVLRFQGRHDEALEVHRKASVLYPHSVALLYQMAADYEALGDEQVAREIRNRILRDFPEAGLGVLRRRRYVAIDSKQWQEAARWQEKIETVLADGDDAQAAQLEEPVQQGLTYQLGLARLESDRAADAAIIFRRLLEKEPRFAPAAIMLGEAHLLLEDETTALDVWRQGFRDTGSPVFLQRLEDYFIEIGEPAQAIENLRSMIARSEDDLLLRFFLGRLYYRVEMLDEASKVLSGIAEWLDSAPTFHYLMGRIRQRRDDPQQAVSHYQAALSRLGIPYARYICNHCRNRSTEWLGRCESCASWGSVDLELEDVGVSSEELASVPLPRWDTGEDAPGTES